MGHFSKLRPIVRTYVYAVVGAGVLTLAISIRHIFVSEIGSEWLLLAGLTILTGSFSVKVPSINAYISVSEAFVFASVLLFGAEAGTITVLLECLVILLWMKPQGRPVYRLLFNLAAPSVAIWCSGQGFYLLSGISPYSRVFTPLPALFLPLLAFTAGYFLLNSWLVAVAVGLETQKPALHIWWKNFAWLSVNYFSGASVAALIVTYTQRLEFSTLAIIVPLLIVSYLTFRTAMGRAEDSYNHLAELNRLYLSTIETLAMAIDAKDQITHGHIRRVQTYAVGLARHVGVTDGVLMKAIEAAALLHDMGKLAVPEHILNKPGRLTAAEFEIMKLHAGVGAEILSAIEFPYPVVPIVRHHHENWDGSGYPDGLAGTDIPIGARILSVVDCFDALTSDRPYRQRLSDDDAVAILKERRGTMYDPLVVDTFVRVHSSIAAESMEEATYVHSSVYGIGEARRALSVTAKAEGTPRAQQESSGDVRRTPSEASTRLLARALTVSYSAALWFKHDEGTNRLTVHASLGFPRNDTRNLSIEVGARLSGWVAANRSSIQNSDATLDLGDIARSLGLTHVVGLPLVSKDKLVGVLSIYKDSVFTDEELSQLRSVAIELPQMADVGDAVTGSIAPVSSTESPAIAPVCSVLFITIDNPEDFTAREDDVCGVLFKLLAEGIKGDLSGSDIVLRGRENELAVLLAREDAYGVRQMARKVRILADRLKSELPAEPTIQVSVDAIFAAIDPATLWTMVSAGKNRTPQREQPSSRHIH